MVPELAARQAPGIIMRRAPVVKLNFTFQFGTISASFLCRFQEWGYCIGFIAESQIVVNVEALSAISYNHRDNVS